MSLKKQKTKDVFYNNSNYTVPYSSLKHLDGIDVVQIEEDLCVYWNDTKKEWMEATQELYVKYSKKREITLNYKGLILSGYINDENTFEHNGKKINKIKLEHYIEYDENSNVWDILDIDSNKYERLK